MIQRSVVGRHHQTWKIREYHLYATNDSRSDCGTDHVEPDSVTALEPDPLNSYLPNGIRFKEHLGRLNVQVADCSRVYHYQRLSPIEAQKKPDSDIQDILLVGEVSRSFFHIYKKRSSHRLYLFSRDIRLGANLVLSDGFGPVMDSSAFLKIMYVSCLCPVEFKLNPSLSIIDWRQWW